MSKLRMTCSGVNFGVDLKVLSFESPMTGEIVSVQTKEAVHHFPVRASQQALRLNVIFSSTQEYMRVQDFIRAAQMWAIRTVENPEIVLYWPERGINNWTGVIRDFRAGDERFNHAPKASIEFLLVDSMLSQKTWASSMGEDFRKFFESNMAPLPDGYLDGDFVRPPSSWESDSTGRPEYYDPDFWRDR